MPYAIIQPPFTLRFREMSKKELRAYATWFHDVTPERLDELTRAVKGIPGYESWGPDLTPESLVLLGQWFESQVETHAKTAEEMAEARAKLTFPIDIPEEELTNKTFSLAMDIGMYFAEVVLKNLPGTHWDQPFGSKRFVDYGQPVLMGFGKVSLNPVRIIITSAYVIADHKPANLREIYDTWASMRG